MTDASGAGRRAHPDVVGDGGDTSHALYGILGGELVKMLVNSARQRNRPADYPDGDMGLIRCQCAPDLRLDAGLDISVRSPHVDHPERVCLCRCHGSLLAGLP